MDETSLRESGKESATSTTFTPLLDQVYRQEGFMSDVNGDDLYTPFLPMEGRVNITELTTVNSQAGNVGPDLVYHNLDKTPTTSISEHLEIPPAECTVVHNDTPEISLKLSNEGRRLKDLLESSADGKQLLKLKVLTGDHRKLLTALIATEILKQNKDSQIRSAHYKSWCKGIQEIFVFEVPIIYYKNSEHIDGSRVAATGKLYSTVCYLRRKANKGDLLFAPDRPKTKGGVQQSVVLRMQAQPLDPSDSSDALEEKHQFLKKYFEPYSTVVVNWIATHSIRLREYGASDMKLHEYYALYPALQTNTGIRLLEVDFETLYPEVGQRFLYRWPEVSLKVIALARQRRIKTPGITDLLSMLDTQQDLDRELIALLLLPLLMPIRNLKRKGNEKLRRPTTLEVQQSFILTVPVMTAVETALTNLVESHHKDGERVQPMVVLVGPLENLQAVYTVVNDVKYLVNTPAQAIDLCYKAYFALSASYPERAKSVWAFLEFYVYQMCDKSNVCHINELVCDLNHVI